MNESITMKSSNQGESLKKNIIYNTAYQMLILILPLVVAPYTSRVLGPESIGEYAYVQAFANYFVLFSMLGVNNYGNRVIAKVRDDRDKLSSKFFEIYAFQLIMTMLVSVIYLTYVLLVMEGTKTIYLLQLMYVISAAFDVNWFYFGLEKFRIIVIRNTIIKTLSAGAIFYFVNTKLDLNTYIFIISFGILISQLVIWPYILKNVDFKKPSIRGVAEHIRPNIRLFIPVIAISIYNIMDKIMLGMFSNTLEVGYYDYALKIVEVPNTIILAIGTVMMPRMSNLFAKGNKTRAEELIQKTMTFSMLFSSAFTFGLAGIAQAFAIWFYGDSFSRSGLFILYLSPIIVFKAIAGVVRTQFLIPNEKDNIYIYSISLGAVTNLIANFFLIPRYAGIGAIIGTVIAEGVVCLTQLYKIRNEVKLKQYLIDELCFSAFGLIMLLIVHKFANVSQNISVSLLIQICLGAMTYMLLVTAYYIIVKKEYQLVNKILNFLHIRFQFE